MSAAITILADLLVAVLLVATIASSVRLSRRITRLQSDESAMRRTIGELMLATETAERAIAGLRTTLGDCDRTLADRLRTAERYAADLATQVEAGESMMGRIGQIVESSRRLQETGRPAPREAAEPRPQARQEFRGETREETRRPPAPEARREPRPAALPAPAPALRLEAPRGVHDERLSAAAAAAQALAERAALRLKEGAA
jgi:hypothetical protein